MKLIFSFSVLVLCINVHNSAAMSSCNVLHAKAHYGLFFQRLENCFDVLISSLKQLIVYSNNNGIRGLKFIYQNDTNDDFLQTNETLKNYTINLVNLLIIGVEVTNDPLLKSLKFHLYDMLLETNFSTFEMGKPSGCYSYLNSSVMHSIHFQIDRIYGCIGNTSYSHLPSLSFEYSFSRCSLISTTVSASRTVTTASTVSTSRTVTTASTLSTATITSKSTIRTINAVTATIKTLTTSLTTATITTITEKRTATTTTRASNVLSSFQEIFANGNNSKLFKKLHQICRNTAIATIDNVLYNTVDESSIGVYLYDINWTYKRTFNFPNTFYAISVNNYFYFSTSDSNNYTYGIIKTTVISPDIIAYYSSRGWYRSLYYDSVNSQIIAAGCNFNSIVVLDLNLTQQRIIDMIGRCPHGVTMFNNKIYVTFWNDPNIVELTNYTITNQYKLPYSANEITSINVDSMGYFAITSYRNGYIYLYNPNLENTNVSILTPCSENFDARLDTNNNLAICCQENVYIYN